MSDNLPPASTPPSDPQVGYPQASPYRDWNQMQPEPKYNVLAIISLVSAFLISLAAIITGHLALSQIKKSGEKGRGLALAGLILGYLGILASAVFLIVTLAVIIPASSAAIDAKMTKQSASAAETRPADIADPQPSPWEGVSKEFCDVVAEMTAQSGTAVTEEHQKALTLETFKRLSEIDSPNQKVYANVHEVLSNPEAADQQAVMDASEPLVLEDIAQCKPMAGSE